MRRTRTEPFEIAYLIAILAALPYFLLLMFWPLWAVVPALVWLICAAVMVHEYRRLVAMEKAYRVFRGLPR